MVSYPLIKQLLRRQNYYKNIGPGGRTIIIAVAARAQGSIIKSQLRHNNGTDEQGLGCYANCRRAHVPGGTKPELDTLGLVSIRDFLNKRVCYLRLVAQNNKADGVNVTLITVVTSIDPELLEILIDMEKIDANSVDDCTDESVMEFLEYTQERDASVTAEFVKAEVLATVTIAMSEKYQALRVMKAVADYYSLHRNMRLDFINGKPKKAVEHLESVIRPATLKALIESKLEMDKSELKKDFLEFVKYLEEMAIIHKEHCHVVEQRRLATLA
jgi:hypothetical protein